MYYGVLRTWVCMGPDGSTCSESLPEQTCHFQPPEHVLRTSAGAQTCVLGPGGLSVCHGAESTRKDRRPEEKKMPRLKKHIYICVCMHIFGDVFFFIFAVVQLFIIHPPQRVGI